MGPTIIGRSSQLDLVTDKSSLRDKVTTIRQRMIKFKSTFDFDEEDEEKEEDDDDFVSCVNSSESHSTEEESPKSLRFCDSTKDA